MLAWSSEQAAAAAAAEARQPDELASAGVRVGISELDSLLARIAPTAQLCGAVDDECAADGLIEEERAAPRRKRMWAAAVAAMVAAMVAPAVAAVALALAVAVAVLHAGSSKAPVAASN